MIYSEDEKRTIVAILIAIMEADGIIDLHETEFLEKIVESFDLSYDDIDQMDDYDFNTVIDKFSNFNDAKKKMSKEIFMEMAKCDGYADPRELKIIADLGD